MLQKVWAFYAYFQPIVLKKTEIGALFYVALSILNDSIILFFSFRSVGNLLIEVNERQKSTLNAKPQNMT